MKDYSGDVPRRFRGKIKHRTERGILFVIEGKDVWLPVAKVTAVEVNELGEGLFEVSAKTANWKGIR